MSKNTLHRSLLLMVAMTLSALAVAAPKPAPSKNAASKTPASKSSEPNAGAVEIKWSASSGLGYDSNAHQAPSAAYFDFSAGKNVTPQAKSGFFIPYAVKMEADKKTNLNNKLTGSASLDGSTYQSGLSNANEYNLDISGGMEHVLNRKGKVENTVYVGAVVGKHKQVYVDHDSGASKASTAGQTAGTDISGRYSYTSMGVEAAYKHRTGMIDYGFDGQYLINDYEDPVVVSQEDHTSLKVGADAGILVAQQTKLNFSVKHTVLDYSKRNARDSLGVLSVNNPLLLYTYDQIGVSLRHRISEQWLVYGDFDRTQRVDDNVGYNDYNQNKIGGRILFEAGRIKGRMGLHHWTRDYPNAFAFDKAGQPAKTYSGDDLKVKAELERTKNSAYWAELVYDAQTSTDLRYDYVRSIIMAGMSWAY